MFFPCITIDTLHTRQRFVTTTYCFVTTKRTIDADENGTGNPFKTIVRRIVGALGSRGSRRFFFLSFFFLLLLFERNVLPARWVSSATGENENYNFPAVRRPDALYGTPLIYARFPNATANGVTEKYLQLILSYYKSDDHRVALDGPGYKARY